MKSDSTTYRDIHARLRRKRHHELHSRLQFEEEWLLGCGLDTRTSETEYYWHGLQRGGDPTHPYLIFQFTLDGVGGFDYAGKTHRLEAGEAFMVTVPSNHCYYLPPNSPSWSFFWLSIHHPYIVERFAQQIAQTGPLLHVPPDTRLFTRTLEIWEQTELTGVRDTLSCEQSLFDWMFEVERFCHSLLHPQDERERWLQDVRQTVLNDLQSSCTVEKLAEQAGLSRTHYSHLFKSATGVSPAAWVQQVRLEEVARRLTNTDDKLQKIASEAGYGDANHLCKVFRRYFHLSPNQFRRQMK